jgi:hypothetical protein
MRRNKFEEVRNQAEGFLMEEGEDHQDMYRLLKALAITFINLGVSHTDDDWVKRKYIKAIMPFEVADLKTLKNKHNYDVMTSNEFMQEMDSFKVESKIVKDSRALGMRRGGNLALKAKAPEEVDEESGDERRNCYHQPTVEKIQERKHLSSKRFTRRTHFVAASSTLTRGGGGSKEKKAREITG